MENLVAFTIYKDSPPVDELITKVPHEGIIREIQVTAPKAPTSVSLSLQIGREKDYESDYTWSTIYGTNLEVSPTQKFEKRDVEIPVLMNSYFRLKCNYPKIDFGLVYQFIIEVQV